MYCREYRVWSTRLGGLASLWLPRSAVHLCFCHLWLCCHNIQFAFRAEWNYFSTWEELHEWATPSDLESAGSGNETIRVLVHIILYVIRTHSLASASGSSGPPSFPPALLRVKLKSWEAGRGTHTLIGTNVFATPYSLYTYIRPGSRRAPDPTVLRCALMLH